MNNTDIKKRIKWVDVAKFFAIIAVMIDHTNGVLYTNQKIAFFSYYSVCVFIIIMGITTIWKLDKKKDKIPIFLWKKCWGIYRPYLIASIIYGLFIYNSFDFETFLSNIIRFNMSLPFYYVLLYIQLVIFSPIIYYFFDKTKNKKLEILYEIIGFIAILAFSIPISNKTNILGVYGGGGKLFGGTFLILLYIGMWFGKHYNKIKLNVIASVLLSIVFLSGTIGWWLFISYDKCHIDSYLPWIYAFNPPSFSFCFYGILITATLFCIDSLISKFPNSFIWKPINVLAFIGKHTLYIFLFHRFFLDIVFPRYIPVLTQFHIGWIKTLCYFSGMILGSLLIELLVEKAYKFISNSYK